MNEVQTLASILKTLPPASREFMFLLLGGLNERAEQAEARVAEVDGVMLELDKDRKPPPFHEGIDMAKAFEKPLRVDVTIARLAARVEELEGQLATKTRERHEAMGARQRAEARVAVLLAMSESLWGLLDDVSTLGDQYKPERTEYVKAVDRICAKRSEHMHSPDGQRLVKTAKREEGGV